MQKLFIHVCVIFLALTACSCSSHRNISTTSVSDSIVSTINVDNNGCIIDSTALSHIEVYKDNHTVTSESNSTENEIIYESISEVVDTTGVVSRLITRTISRSNHAKTQTTTIHDAVDSTNVLLHNSIQAKSSTNLKTIYISSHDSLSSTPNVNNKKTSAWNIFKIIFIVIVVVCFMAVIFRLLWKYWKGR